jgi:hypothetical protein
VVVPAFLITNYKLRAEGTDQQQLFTCSVHVSTVSMAAGTAVFSIRRSWPSEQLNTDSNNFSDDLS